VDSSAGVLVPPAGAVEFKQLAPVVPVAMLYYGVPLNWAGDAVDWRQRHQPQQRIPRRALLADAESHGLKVNVFTVTIPGKCCACG